MTRENILRAFTVNELKEPGYLPRIAKALEQIDRAKRRTILVCSGTAKSIRAIVALRNK